MSVYSTQFFCGIIPSSNLNLYTVPSGFVVVLRSIELADRSGTNNNNVTIFAVAGSTVIGVVTASVFTAAYQSIHWDGRAVLNAGQGFGAGVSVSCGIFVSGYLLTTP